MSLKKDILFIVMMNQCSKIQLTSNLLGQVRDKKQQDRTDLLTPAIIEFCIAIDHIHDTRFTKYHNVQL